MEYDFSKLVKFNSRTDYIWGFMEKSAQMVLKVEPLLLPLLRTPNHTYKLHCIEGDKTDSFKLFTDIVCGVDYYIIRDDNVSYTLATRTQVIKPGQSPYNTFTVRHSRNNGAKTEYAKYSKAIREDGVYPSRLLQIYYEERTDRILSFALARTRDVVKYIDDGLSYVSKIPGHGMDGQNSFYVIDWKALQNRGCLVHIWPQNTD